MESPFVCNPGALSSGERAEYGKLSARILGAMVATRELENGYECDIDPAAVTFMELATWIDLERRCCPFFDFAVEWSGGRQLKLRLSGPDGVKEFIRTEFGAFVE